MLYILIFTFNSTNKSENVKRSMLSYESFVKHTYFMITLCKSCLEWNERTGVKKKKQKIKTKSWKKGKRRAKAREKEKRRKVK